MIEIKYSEIEFIFALVLVIVAGIQIFYYSFFYLRLAWKRKEQAVDYKEMPVSIIICAKNQEENLRKFLPLVLQQKYSNFEVIVVNDCSQDDTEIYVTNLQKVYSHLKYTFIKEDLKFKHGKKLAVTVGIKAASNDHFVFIDADCCPPNENWLYTMSSHFNKGMHLVLGYGGYYEEEGFLDKLVRYDTYFVALNYLSFAKAGLPYMGVGRNMAYSRELYMKSSRFTKHYHILSGDDDLFVSEVGRKNNTAIELHPDTYTRSEQVQTLSRWVSQKSRHLTSSHKYRFVHKFLLSLEPLSREMFYLMSVLYFAFMLDALFIPVAILLFIRLLLFIIVHARVTKRLQERNIFFVAFLLDIILPFTIAGLLFKNKFQKRKYW